MRIALCLSGIVIASAAVLGCEGGSGTLTNDPFGTGTVVQDGRGNGGGRGNGEGNGEGNGQGNGNSENGSSGTAQPPRGGNDAGITDDTPPFDAGSDEEP